MKTQLIFATNKKVPRIIREYYEEGKVDKMLTKTNIKLFESGAKKFMRVFKGDEVLVASVYEEDRHLKLEYFKYIVELPIRTFKTKKTTVDKVMDFFRKIKWTGLK